MKERSIVKVLGIGAGGREHAIAWRLSKPGREVFTAPGNAGTEQVGENVPIDVKELDRLVAFASDNKIGLTIVGPELPLSLGIVDAFTKEGLLIFGPTQEAARLETSKAFAVSFMESHNIPHPDSVVFDSPEKARQFVEHPKWARFVIKASGLAAGKGTFLPETLEEAYAAIDDIMVKQVFSKEQPAGVDNRVVIQERLEGQEISLLAISDGTTVVPLLPSQDHKRAFDGDKGPNTGGMGAYAPAGIMTEALLQEAYRTILKPTINGMKEEGCPFKGVLYAGLMLTKDGPKVLEYNVRFGDPELQPLMMLLSSDLANIAQASVGGKLTPSHVKFNRGVAVAVVLASEGYPGTYKKGEIIHGLETVSNPNIQIFHAGTTRKDGQLVTSGGRVLAVTAYDRNIQQALRKAYDVIGEKGVRFNGMQFRRDIGWRDVQRLRRE